MTRLRTPLAGTGFSLAELICSLVISAMVLAATLAIYQRMQRTAEAVLAKVDQSDVSSEVLQLIAEDLDSVTAAQGIQITFDNKTDKGFPVAKLSIRKTVTNKKNEEQLFEEIQWQGAYDAGNGRVTLYRSHSGLAQEDRLLDRQRADVEKLYPFVPVCGGFTTFKIEAPQGNNLLSRWANPMLPTGLRVTLSVAEPVRSPLGRLEVPEESLITRMIAIDRTRQIRFEFAAWDANSPAADANQPGAETPDKKAAADGNQPSRNLREPARNGPSTERPRR
jgi:type II secretory pathway pseudopilin PulG